MKKKGFIITIAAPSGGGKSTILNKALTKLPQVKYSISYTTRLPRGDEKDGVDYYFVTEDEFLQKKRDGFFLEFAQVHGSWYGTSKEYVQGVLESGNHVIMDIDVQGVAQVKQQGDDIVSIFVLPPNYSVLENRLHARNTDCIAQIEQRLINSKKEIDQLNEYDYLVINDDLDKAVECVVSIITVEENRVKRYVDPIEEFYKN